MVVGKSNKEIGSTLRVTEGTVKVHVNHILSKFGVAGRVEAIIAAVQRGFVHLLGNHPDGGLAGQEGHSAGSRPSNERISKAIEAVKPTSQLRAKK